MRPNNALHADPGTRQAIFVLHHLRISKISKVAPLRALANLYGKRGLGLNNCGHSPTRSSSRQQDKGNVRD